MTVYDYLQSKGKKQLSVLFVHNVDEAEAAEEADTSVVNAEAATQIAKYSEESIDDCNIFIHINLLKIIEATEETDE